MRLKYILLPLASALALTAASAGAQVYSTNVVGYVNVALRPGYNLIENPLDGWPDNNINHVIPSPPDGTMMYLWNVGSQAFDSPSTYDPDFGGWDVIVDLPPGRGFFWYAPEAYTHTFVGSVRQGTLTTFIAGNNKLSALGSQVPYAGRLSADHAFPIIDGANVFQFNSTSQSYIDAITCFNGYGWFDPNRVADTGGPVIDLAQAFFVQNPGSDVNWVRTFVVPLVSPPAIAGFAATAISSLQISGGAVTLKVRNPSGTPYTVQFSPDGLSWSSVASGLTSSVWQGKNPGGARGYYHVIQP